MSRVAISPTKNALHGWWNRATRCSELWRIRRSCISTTHGVGDPGCPRARTRSRISGSRASIERRGRDGGPSSRVDRSEREWRDVLGTNCSPSLPARGSTVGPATERADDSAGSGLKERSMTSDLQAFTSCTVRPDLTCLEDRSIIAPAGGRRSARPVPDAQCWTVVGIRATP